MESQKNVQELLSRQSPHIQYLLNNQLYKIVHFTLLRVRKWKYLGDKYLWFDVCQECTRARDRWCDVY